MTPATPAVPPGTPEAAGWIDQLPPVINRLLAIAILFVLATYVGWVWSAQREIGRGDWKVKLPSGPSTLLQIAIGIIDLGFCALAMYVLVPDEPNLGFIVVAVIFVSATLLGFASHSPGGLGVFDAAMLVGLWQMDREDLLAGMLLFRRRLVNALGARRHAPAEIDAIQGQEALLFEPLPAGTVGKAELRGAVWNVRNAGDVDLAAGARCRVESVDGLTLIVKG